MSTGAADRRCGHEPASGMYFEAFGDPSEQPPWLFIHGAAGTGALWHVTPDGRPGWAARAAMSGRQCWLVDWPGLGRSGGLDPLRIGLDDVVDGVVNLCRDIIGRPVVIVAHSMGGAVAWRVAELARPFVSAVVGLAPAVPGNLAPRAIVVQDAATEVTLRHPDHEIEIRIPRDRHFLMTEEVVQALWTAPGDQFPRDHVAEFRHTIVPMPPRLMLQRLGADDGIPRVCDTAAYAGLPVLVVTATADPTHTPALAQPIVDELRRWGAEAELLHLGDHAIADNGHFMFVERNSDAILDLVTAEVTARLAPTDGGHAAA